MNASLAASAHAGPTCSRRKNSLFAAMSVLLALTSVACGSQFAKGDYRWIGGVRSPDPGKGALRVQWTRELTPAKRGAYRPVENAIAAIDAKHGRLYVGAVSGELHAYTLTGQDLYRFDLHEAIECEPALDVDRDELYTGTERGELYALTPSKGLVRWKIETTGAIRRRPLLAGDAVYVITEEDVVEAYARADGSVLWRYEREPEEGFLVAGHAGLLLLDGGHLITAFNDGHVVSLDALDGHLQWDRDTSADVPETDAGRPRYTDVDSTPVSVGGMLFVGSFGAGLYALDPNNGSVLFRDRDWTGVTGLAAADDNHGLIVVSADHGLAYYDPSVRAARWVRPAQRGSLGVPNVVRGMIVLGESKGSLLAIEQATGNELSRIDAGHGFVAATAIEAGRAYVVTNGGTLLAMRVVAP